MRFNLRHLDDLVEHFGIKYVFIESGKSHTEAKCEEMGLDKSHAKHFWVELSWGSGIEDEFDFAYNAFGDTLSKAVHECLRMFRLDVCNGQSPMVEAAKKHNILEEMLVGEITHVATMRNGTVYSLPKPNRHHDILHNVMPKKGNDDHDVQGFLLHDGTFLNRKDAYVIACRSGQINRRVQPGNYNGEELFSEDLW